MDGIARDSGALARAKKEFLPIETEGPLTGLFSNKNPKIKNEYQFYRPLSSLLVHNSFDYIVSSTLMLVIWASYFEVFLGKWRTPFIFFLTGIIGHLGSAAFDGPSGNAMGASAGIFGIVGSIIGFLIVNWNNMDYPNSPRTALMIQLVFILLLTVLLSGRFSQTLANVCGFLAGIPIGCFLSQTHTQPNQMPKDLSTYEKVTMAVGIVTTLSLSTGFILVIILSKN